jgi:hypothetical protein
VGITSPSIIYNLGHLLELGIVERVNLPGGRVLYVSNWEIKPQLSPSLQTHVDIAAKKHNGVRGLMRLSLRELKKELKDLNDEEFKEVIRYLTYGEESK